MKKPPYYGGFSVFKVLDMKTPYILPAVKSDQPGSGGMDFFILNMD